MLTLKILVKLFDVKMGVKDVIGSHFSNICQMQLPLVREKLLIILCMYSLISQKLLFLDGWNHGCV